jgi:hypothetical protein
LAISIPDCPKVLRDGKVAVLYADDFGGGWYTAHQIEELLFDPEVVDMVERKVNPVEIIEYCVEHYGSDKWFQSAPDLAIQWIPEGSIFRINEYDGNESVRLQDDDNWTVA